MCTRQRTVARLVGVSYGPGYAYCFFRAAVLLTPRPAGLPPEYLGAGRLARRRAAHGSAQRADHRIVDPPPTARGRAHRPPQLRDPGPHSARGHPHRGPHHPARAHHRTARSRSHRRRTKHREGACLAARAERHRRRRGSRTARDAVTARMRRLCRGRQRMGRRVHRLTGLAGGTGRSRRSAGTVGARHLRPAGG